jgi:tetratricopeptide (TPR) repeat protein
MRSVALVATLMLVGLAPRASLAQLHSVADEQLADRSTQSGPSAANALAEWEEALAGHVTDADAWSAIGQRLYAAGRYRESIAACEQSVVQRNRHSPADAKCIADAYAKLGNVKQAARWKTYAGGVALPSHRPVRTNV